MTGSLRPAHRSDIPAMHRIRMAVRENRLVSLVLTEEHYIPEIGSTGRGWVAEEDGVIVGFAIGNATNGNIWALFVDPDHEGRGHGRRLHDEMVAWLWSQGLKRLHLTTAPGTRAQRLYESAGWRKTGVTSHGEVAYELCLSSQGPPPSQGASISAS